MDLGKGGQILENVKAGAHERLEQAQDRQRLVREARCGLSQDYHPFDLQTGEAINASDAETRLEKRFASLAEIVVAAKLSSLSRERIAKAHRVLPSMIATLVFFWSMIANRVGRLNHSPEIMQLWRNELVAGHYIARVVDRCEKAEERKRLRTLSETILARARSPDRPFASLPEPVRLSLEQQARSAADIFQRSSSCVEGRNGQLSLRHHGLRELTTSKLRALRVLHNYAVRRLDGTTAAERFFGQPPQSLFLWLVERLPLPRRPRNKTS